MIKLGVIGYGGMGSWHARYVAKVDGIEACAAYDIDPEKVAAAKEAGLAGYDKLEDFLNDKEIGLVVVATPNNVHRELCVAAMDAGKNVLCEKPVAMNEAELDDMIAASKRNKVLFTVHQNRRWDRDYRTMKAIFDQGMVGQIYRIESALHGTGGMCHGWRGAAEQGGGMLYDWGIHLIDQMLMLVPDEIVQIYCQQQTVKNPGVDDFFHLNISYKSGLQCTVEVGTYSIRGIHRRFLAYGDEGGSEVIGFNAADGGITRTLKLKEKFEPTIIETVAGPTRTFAPQPPETLVESALPLVETDLIDYYNNIRDTIEGKSEQIVKHMEMKRVMRVVDTAFASAKAGKSMDFKDVK